MILRFAVIVIICPAPVVSGAASDHVAHIDADGGMIRLPLGWLSTNVDKPANANPETSTEGWRQVDSRMTPGAFPADWEGVGWPPGFWGHIGTADSLAMASYERTRTVALFLGFFAAVFLSFTLLHLLLFSFYPERQENLDFAGLAAMADLLVVLVFCMSAQLSSSFAATNRKPRRRLDEVERLSAEKLEHELERQHLADEMAHAAKELAEARRL